MLPTGRAWTGAVAVLVLGLSASLGAAYAAARLEARAAGENLDRRTAAARGALTAEIRRYESTVAQLAASLGAQEDLTADDFDMITEPLAGFGYAGAAAAAFVVPVEDGQVEQAQARWRASGATGLTLHPAGNGQHYFAAYHLKNNTIHTGGEHASYVLLPRMSCAYSRWSKLMLSANCSTRRSVAWANTPDREGLAKQASPSLLRPGKRHNC